jgi:hypothetical protein
MIYEHIEDLMQNYNEEHPHNVGDSMHVHGFIYVRTFDPTSDETIQERFTPNLITNGGFGKYLECVLGALATDLSGTFMGIGTVSSSLAATDTTLQGEIAVARGGGTFTHTATTAQGTVSFTYGTGGPWAIVELALFDAASSGTMISRGTFPVVNKGTADAFQGIYIHSLS